MELTKKKKGGGQTQWFRIGCLIFIVAIGALHTWAAITSQSMNADGISYLDIGDAYMKGDWQTAINSVWSPMYSWILGFVMLITDPPMRWEFPVVHMVNYAIYVFALFCFEFFWRQLTRYRRIKTKDESGERLTSLPEWAWISLGYILFIFSSLQLIQIWAVTPDMLMAAFVYLAAGLIVRIRLGFTNWRTFILLGVVLGLSYLTKTVMFPLAFVFIIVSLFSVGNLRRTATKVLVTLLFFLMFSLPFIAAVSITKGELSFGDVGRMTYARHINGVPYPHWQGDPPGNGMPKHPSRKIFNEPPIYEFSTPIAGTYPISYNPSYWYDGVIINFDLKNQLRYLLTSTIFYYDLFFCQQSSLLFGVLLFYLMSQWNRFRFIDIISKWGLVIPALAAFCFYGLVCIAGRYIGVFVVIFWADLLANVRLPDSQLPRRLASLLSITMVFLMMMNILAFNLEGFRKLMGLGNPHKFAIAQSGRTNWPGEVAQELHRLGVERGAKVGVIGYAFNSFWARLARVKIVAEMLGSEADKFWRGDASMQSEVIQAFASAGARSIVAEDVPNYAILRGWQQINDTNYYVYLLGSQKASKLKGQVAGKLKS